MQKGKEHLNSEFRIKLQQELSRRMRINERYSLRAYANHLDLDSSTLSQILSGKRNLSDKKIESLCKKIGIAMPVIESNELNFQNIDLDVFSMIADWYHYAILDLTQLKSFKPDPKWIEKKLGIQKYQATMAIDRLKRLGFLIEKNGRLVKAHGFYSSYHEGDTSASLKEYQRQVITKALQAVDGCPQELKDITSITIAANTKKLKLAKEKIKNFRRELCQLMEVGEKDAVYHLTVQLYPVTEFEN